MLIKDGVMLSNIIKIYWLIFLNYCLCNTNVIFVLYNIICIYYFTNVFPMVIEDFFN